MHTCNLPYPESAAELTISAILLAQCVPTAIQAPPQAYWAGKLACHITWPRLALPQHPSVCTAVGQQGSEPAAWRPAAAGRLCPHHAFHVRPVHTNGQRDLHSLAARVALPLCGCGQPHGLSERGGRPQGCISQPVAAHLDVQCRWVPEPAAWPGLHASASLHFAVRLQLTICMNVGRLDVPAMQLQCSWLQAEGGSGHSL